MKIELKNYKPCHNLSRETNAFTASIYIDGKRVGTVENNGGGGCHDYGFTDRKVEQNFFDHCNGLPPEEPTADDPQWIKDHGPMKMNPDMVIDNLLTVLSDAKWMKTQLRTKVLVKMKDSKKGEYLVYKCPKVKGPDYRKRLVAHIVTEHGNNIVQVHA